MSPFEQVRTNIRRMYDSMRTTRPEAGNGRPTLSPPDAPASNGTAPVHIEHLDASTISRDDRDVPRGLRVAAAWSWRLLVIGALFLAIVYLIGRVQVVIIPLAIALLLSALFAPAVNWLQRHGLPRSLATGLVMVGGLIAVAGTLTLVISQFIQGAPDLANSATDGMRQIQDWLKNGRLHLSDTQLDNLINSIQKWVDEHSDDLTSSAVSTAATVFDVFAGLVLVLFSTFFFLRDGRRIWQFLTLMFPREYRARITDAGESSWGTLVAYVRATVLVAFIDAVGIGLALVILRVPLAFPLAALVFLGAFIPIVGATISGAVAVLVALVGNGPIPALIVLGAVIGVQQLEGHVLQPFIMGRAVAIHPLAVIVAIATGVVLAGIMGALVAVPIVAVLNTGIRRLVAHRREQLAIAAEKRQE